MIKKNELHNLDNINTLVFDMDYTIIRYITFNEIIKSKKIYLFPIVDYILSLAFTAINNSKNFELFFNKLSDIKRKLGLDGEFIINIISKVLFPYVLPITNIEETIVRLSYLYEIDCFSDFSYKITTMELNKIGLRDKISRVVISKDGNKKINLNSYNNLLEIINKNPSEIIMIGNSIVDVQASKLGINTILMDYDNSKTCKNNEFLYANAVLTEAKDLQLLLLKHK